MPWPNLNRAFLTPLSEMFPSPSVVPKSICFAILCGDIFFILSALYTFPIIGTWLGIIRSGLPPNSRNFHRISLLYAAILLTVAHRFLLRTS